MNKDSIIGIAVLIILALVAINYFNFDCSALTEKGSKVSQDYVEPEQENVAGSGWLPPPTIAAEEAGEPGSGSDAEPGSPPLQPSPAPPGPPMPPGP